MNQDGNPTDKFVHVPEKINYNGLLKNTIIGCLTVMIDIEKLGRYKCLILEHVRILQHG